MVYTRKLLLPICQVEHSSVANSFEVAEFFLKRFFLSCNMWSDHTLYVVALSVTDYSSKWIIF